MESVTLVRIAALRGNGWTEIEAWVNPAAVTFVEPRFSVSDNVVGARVHFGTDHHLDTREIPELVIGRLTGWAEAHR